MAGALRTAGNRRAEAQPRQLRRGRPASAASLARRRWPAQAALVPILAAAWSQPSAGHGPAAGRHAAGVASRIEVATVEEQIQSWDCAFKDLETSDYVVGQVWGRAGVPPTCCAIKSALAWIARRRSMPSASSPRSGRSTVAKLIEDKANGSAVIQMLAHEIPGILPVNPEGGKVARAAAVSPLIEAGNVYLPHPQFMPWVKDFIEECAAFPNGAHDDQVDAMTQALLRWNMVPEQTVVYYSEPVRISPI